MSKPLDRFFAPTPSPKGRKKGSSTTPKAKAAASTPATPKAKGGRRRRVTLPLARSTGRVRALLIVVAIVFSLAAGRAVQVQAIDASNVAAEAADQMTVSHVLPAFRGTIADRNGDVLAQTEDTVRITADDKMIRTNGRGSAEMTESDKAAAAAAPGKIAAILAEYLGGTAEDYLPKLTVVGAGESVQKIKDKVTAETYREISAAMSAQKLVGLSSTSEPTRVYPNGVLAANLLGFLKDDGTGASGLEYSLNSILAGKDGKEAYETSPNGKIPLGDSALVEPVNGRAVQLTIDSGMQWQLEQILGDRVRQTNATRATAIVTNIKTGEVLALAQYPSFDPNDGGAADQDNVPARAATDPYTPGSVQKVLTLSALIDMGLTSPSDVVTVPARVKSGDQYITDAESHGKIKLYTRGVLAKSSNIGTILLSRRADKAALHDYYTSFGLGSKTGLGLPGESSGVLPPANMPDYARDGLAFGGSAVSVTMLQEAAAIGAVANGGVYVPLKLIKSTTLADGTVQEQKTADPHRVVSTEAANDVVGMMETMAQASTSHTFDVEGYRVGAKTGTSKKFDTSCNCFRGLVTSAISVAPVQDPQILVYVVVDSPLRGSAGVSVAGPAVQDAMSIALARYGIPQNTGKVPHLPVSPDKKIK
ncbi:MAG: penicillin-binding protein 2 [Propionicimonas sp.]|uniref:peptidoglycan D,D-transpeptidase FtsI family protein n=1 Tax=Propionicimonas sp. TaxID=1955623 RepID=UPI003D0A69F0